MEKTNLRLQQLLENYLKESISEIEKHELWDYINDPIYQTQIMNLISDSFERENEGVELPESKQNELLQYFYTEGGSFEDKGYKRRLWPIFTAAAAVLLVLSTVFYFKKDTKSTIKQSAYVDDIKPGKNGATLKLANGKIIHLFDNKKGVIIGKKFTYSDGEEISSEQGVQDITASTTKGQTYQIVLPDGTKAWLNATSSIKFPSSFEGHKLRQVEVIGEVYLEVTTDKKHPFIVKTGRQEIKVLGTKFNINAYPDESSIKTTLLEGLVSVTPFGADAKKSSQILKPGQQALTDEHQTTIFEVDVDKALAWKNAKFVFDDENIESIMRKLARWYNVEVVYQDHVVDRTFTGSISRYDNISKILDKITYIEAVQFKIEGRRITVMK